MAAVERVIACAGAAYSLFRCATRPRWSLPWPPFGTLL